MALAVCVNLFVILLKFGLARASGSLAMSASAWQQSDDSLWFLREMTYELVSHLAYANSRYPALFITIWRGHNNLISFPPVGRTYRVAGTQPGWS